MSKTLAKLLIWAALVLLSGLGLWVGLQQIGALLAYFQRGADPATALNLVPNVPLDLNVALHWLPDDPDPGRALEPYTRTQIEAAYLRAWLQWNISYLKDEPYGLKTYFVGPALAAVDQSVTDLATQNLHLEQADLSHLLQLHFYSADGSVVSFTDTQADVAQVVRDSTGQVIVSNQTQAAYDVVMFLDDGNWRVRHWVRAEAQAATAGVVVPPATTAMVQAQNLGLVINGQPYVVAGINYYPQKTPWDSFWPKYDSAVTDSDFARIQSLGLNTIRIFIPFTQFGGAHVDATLLAHLDDLLAQADQHGLKVIVTLFDFRSDYSLLHWPDADRQLETLLTHYRDNPAILAWDLKNEPDADYKASTPQLVNAWLAHIATLARQLDPNHLLTIGWSTPQAAQSLPQLVDVISFHYYAPAADLSAQYALLRKAVPNRPILLGEFGLPTWNSFFFPNGHSEPEQTEYYANVLTSLRTTDSVGYMAWDLYDYDSVPASVAGRWPWQTGPQKQLGILRGDGSAKPAAALLAPGASLTVTQIPFWARFLKPFYWTILGLIVVGGMFLNIWRKYAQRPKITK